jgi:hypothetical protein
MSCAFRKTVQRVAGDEFLGDLSFEWQSGNRPEFWSQVQQIYANRIFTSLPSSLRIAWRGVLKPRHFQGVRLAVMTMSWISRSDTLSMSI